MRLFQTTTSAVETLVVDRGRLVLIVSHSSEPSIWYMIGGLLYIPQTPVQGLRLEFPGQETRKCGAVVTDTGHR